MRGSFFPLLLFIAVVWFIHKDYEVPVAGGAASAALSPGQNLLETASPHIAMPQSAKELLSTLTAYRRAADDTSIFMNARGFVFREGKYFPVHFLRNSHGINLWLSGEPRLNTWSDKQDADRIRLFNDDPYSLVVRTYQGELIYLKYFTSHARGVLVTGFTGWLLPDASVDSPAQPITVVSDWNRAPASAVAEPGLIAAAENAWPQPGEVSPYMRWLRPY